MKPIKFCQVVFMLSLTPLSAVSYAENIDTDSFKQPGGTMFFFEHGLPVGISSQGDLNISDFRQKDGKNSLKWDFKPGDSLIFNHHIGYKDYIPNNKDQSRSTFSTWVYNTKPQNNTAKIAFYEQGHERISFKFNLNFSGWRQLLVPFSDMEGIASENMDSMQVHIPKTASAGQLYWDQTMLSLSVDPRWPTRDTIVPFVNMATDTAPNSHWLSLYRYHQFLSKVPLDKSAFFPSDVAAIYHRLDTIVGDLDTKYKLDDIRELYQQYQLTDVDGVVNGLPLDNSNRLKNFLDKGVNRGLLNDEGFDIIFDVRDLREYSDLLLSIALIHKKTTDIILRNELASMYVMLTRYALDQGYSAESGLGTAHHMGYTMRALFDAHYIARELLAENNILDDVANMMAWYSLTGRIYRPVNEMKNFNVDIMNTQLRGMLYSILMQSDSARTATWLKQYQFWLSQSISNSKGLGGGFKTDGSIFHHAQHYPAYANGALKGITPVVYALSGTPYAVDAAAHQVLKNAVLMTDISSHNTKVLLSVTGRHPDGKQDIAISPFRFMALAGTPDKKQSLDTEMAQIYLRLMNKKDDFSVYFKEQGITPNQVAIGNWAMNFANLSLHRRDNWLVSMRGFSRYLVSHESYANANRFGRYINYGQLEITNDKGQGRAFSHDGWNWNRWPGTTTIQRPMAELEAELRNVDTFSGLEEMLLSEQTYSGALSHENNGMFAMKLQGHPKYDKGFSANKSVFFFDDRIIALGSNINTKDNNTVQTTLFQHALPLQKLTSAIDAEVAIPNVLMDPANNAYIITADQKLIMSEGEQQSLHQQNSTITKGSFITAVLDHGVSPRDGHYQYAVLVDPDEQQVTNFTQSLNGEFPAYQVKEKKASAHIVWDRDSNTTGYALFSENKHLDDALIIANGQPLMVMTTSKNKQLTLSIVNPDLNLYQGIDSSQYNTDGTLKEVSIYSRTWKDNKSQLVPVSLTLKGKWILDKKPNTLVKLQYNSNGTTQLIMSTQKATPVTLYLKKPIII